MQLQSEHFGIAEEEKQAGGWGARHAEHVRAANWLSSCSIRSFHSNGMAVPHVTEQRLFSLNQAQPCAPQPRETYRCKRSVLNL